MLSEFYGLSALEVIRYVPEDVFRVGLSILKNDYDVKVITTLQMEMNYYKILISNNLIKDKFVPIDSSDPPIDKRKFQRLTFSTDRTVEEKEIIENALFSGKYEYVFNGQVKNVKTGQISEQPLVSELLNEFIRYLPKITRYLEIIQEIISAPHRGITYLDQPVYNLRAINKYWFYNRIEKFINSYNMSTEDIISVMDGDITKGLDGVNTYKKLSVNQFTLSLSLINPSIDIDKFTSKAQELLQLYQTSLSNYLSSKELDVLNNLFLINMELEEKYSKYSDREIAILEDHGLYFVNGDKVTIFLQLLSSYSLLTPSSFIRKFKDIFASLELDRGIIKEYLYNRDVRIGQPLN